MYTTCRVGVLSSEISKHAKISPPPSLWSHLTSLPMSVFSGDYGVIFFLERLTVNISVDYTSPNDFTAGPNEYRAASGPVTVTCTATGAGTGTISYQWSSDCRRCPFQSATSSSITRAAVHSGDNGTHTCVATRDGKTAQGSINFLVVGERLLVTPYLTSTFGSAITLNVNRQ